MVDYGPKSRKRVYLGDGSVHNQTRPVSTSIDKCRSIVGALDALGSDTVGAMGYNIDELHIHKN